LERELTVVVCSLSAFYIKRRYEMAYQEETALLSDLILYLSRITPEDLEKTTLKEHIERFFSIQERQAFLEIQKTIFDNTLFDNLT
jgi:hypothetical protein